MEKLQWLLDLLESVKANPVLSGIFGASLVGGIWMFIRTMPGRIWSFIVRNTTVTLTITNSESEFQVVEEWLASLKSLLPVRDYRPVRRSNEITAGLGTNIFWFKGFMRVSRTMQDNQHNKEKSETIFITVLGHSRHRLEAIMQTARDWSNRQNQNKLKMYVWEGNNWTFINGKDKRSIDTVYIDPVLKQRLITDTKRFASSKEWYAQRGIPWRRGYMLYGPPGTGKTTILQALAAATDRTIMVLNVASLSSDEHLERAFRGAFPGAMLVLEDIDAVGVTEERAKPVPIPKPGDEPKTIEDEDEKGWFGITLSGLLNAIDGVATGEGYQLFMTTNHPEKLDAALIREGRVDVKIEVGFMEPELVEAMAKTFFPDRPDMVQRFYAEARDSEPRVPAYWQERMMRAAIDSWDHQVTKKLKEAA